MDIAKDLMASLRDRVSPPLTGSPEGMPDWADLHARLAAAHAAAGELARGASATVFGGFGQWQGSEGISSRPVNPTDLADGKSDQCNEVAIVGESIADGRGQ